MDARVIRHSQVIENQADITCELPHFLCDVGCSFGFQYPNGESSKSGHVFKAKAGAYPVSIFIVVPIKDVMTAILNAPMAPIGGENALGVSILRGLAGNAIGNFTRVIHVPSGHPETMKRNFSRQAQLY
jgi:hypothetical protein